MSGGQAAAPIAAHRAVHLGGPVGAAKATTSVHGGGQVVAPAHGAGGTAAFSLRAKRTISNSRGGQARVISVDNFGEGNSFSQDFSSAPGLGFDYVHEAAVHPNAGRGRRGENNGTVLFPVFGGGYGGYYPASEISVANEGEADSQQPVEDDDEHARTRERYSRERRVWREPAAVEMVEEPAPQADVPEYVFVRRDGTVFFAVAYTWDGGALRYVSSEGLRKSVAREALDLGATQQFNEQRGMVFRAPV